MSVVRALKYLNMVIYLNIGNEWDSINSIKKVATDTQILTSFVMICKLPPIECLNMVLQPNYL